AKTKTKIKMAQVEMSNIQRAIHEYEAQNNRFPVSNEAMQAANSANRNEDFTYGADFLAANAGLPLTSGYVTNNSEVMAILLDLETYPDSRHTVNFGHVKNPQKTSYLNVKRVSDKASPGVGQDLVYRDPWGNPYIITFDLNYDQKARDAFYRLRS